MFSFKILARLLGSLTAVAALALSPVAQADSGPFIGASIGNATVSADIPDPVDPIFNPDINFDEDDFAWKVYGGFAFDLPVIALRSLRHGLDLDPHLVGAEARLERYLAELDERRGA